MTGARLQATLPALVALCWFASVCNVAASTSTEEPGISERGPATTSPPTHVISGNPLWDIPIKSLIATRERPIFSPSRRPPPAAVTGAPYIPPPPPPPSTASKVAKPERPRLSLVGAIIGDNTAIAVFVDAGTRDVIRLKIGEGHAGWILRSVRGREAVLENGQETATIALPVPVGEHP